jgi:hypothetical protein
MIKKAIFILVALIFLLIISASNAYAQFESHKEALKGLQGVTVLVEDIDYEKDTNLTVEELKTIAESKLRDSGLLLEKPKSVRAYQPFLVVCVKLQPISEDNKLFAFYFELALYELTKLERDPQTRVVATLWRINSFGMVGWKAAHDSITDLVGDAVDKFIYDYYNANLELDPSLCQLKRVTKY